MLSVTPPLEDLVAPGLRVLFCGTAPSERSVRERAYYAHPGNAFYRALFEAGFTPRRFAPQEYRQLLDLGIGLTDLNKRSWGNDRDLPPGDFDLARLDVTLTRFRPRCLAFTSKSAAQIYLGHPVDYGLNARKENDEIDIYALPSPSGQARRYWSLKPWQALAQNCGFVRQRRKEKAP